MRRSPLKRRIATLREQTVRRGGVSLNRIKHLDKLARQICMIRAGAFELDGTDSWIGPCTKCGLQKPLQWVHLVTRSVHALRWADVNTCVMCSGCHFGFMHRRNRSDPTDTNVADWWRNRIGESAYKQLLIIKNTPRRPDYAGLRLALEADLRSLVRTG